MLKLTEIKLLTAASPEAGKFKRAFHQKEPAHFVFFAKGKNAKPPRSAYSPLSASLKKSIADANKAGMHISMAINHSNGGKRVKENFDRVIAVFIDKDTGKLTRKDLQTLPIKPHVIVRTSKNRFHAYWFVSDCPVDMFAAVQAALAKRFGTDPSIIDINRVMRMPGTYNTKYSPPFLTTATYADDLKPVNLERLISKLELDITGPACAAEKMERRPEPKRGLGLEGAELKKVLEALALIPNDERSNWFTVGKALNSADPSDHGFQIWTGWSQSSQKFDQEEQRRTWQGFTPSGGTTLGTLFRLAKLNGDPAVGDAVDESALAERFCALYRDVHRYDPLTANWYTFDGTIWVPGGNAPLMAAREMVNLMAQSRSATSSSLRSFRHAAGLKSIISHAQLVSGFHIKASEFDQTAHLLAVGQGVIDLQTGQSRPATAADQLARRAAVDYDPAAQCPRWVRFVMEVVEGDESYCAMLQRILGYSMFGHAKEQKFFLMIGSGGNGKGVLVRTVKALLGPYAHAVAPNVLSRAYSGNPNSPSPALAPLQHARFVICTELSNGIGLDEAFLKQLAGGDELSARATYGDLVTFKPPGKLWVSTNHMPEIDAGDAAMWRRLIPLPFAARFGGNKADSDLEAKLEAERPGILNWLIEGAVAYARDGVGSCGAVDACRKQLKLNADSVLAWMKECCHRDEGALLSAGQAFDSYQKFMRDAKRKPLSNKEFPARLADKGFARKKRNDGNYFKGLRLLQTNSGQGSGGRA